jgi:predicted TIM-barrel fold metal-dependent hydrolase
MYDPFWARVNEAGILVAYHSGDSGYHRYAEDWGASGQMEAFRYDPFRNITGGHRPIHDTMAALICHGVFSRHPNVRVATIESGSDWVPLLHRALKKAYGQVPGAFGGHDPLEQLRRHVWVSPYYEDDLLELRDAIGADHIVFGSDYPHAEGLAVPKAFVDDLSGFDAGEIKLVMRENALALSRPRAA